MKKLLLVAVSGFLATQLYGLPAYEPFADATGSGGTSYTPGQPLAGAGPGVGGQTDAQGNSWYIAGPSSTTTVIQSGNLSISGLPPSQGNSVLMTPANNSAARFAFGASINSGSLYYSFILKVPDIGTTLGSGGGFVAGFNNTGAASQTTSPTVIGARTLLRSVGGGTGFNIGLSKSSSTVTDFQWASPTFTTTDTIFIVGAYDINVLGTQGDDSSRMWVNPNSSDFGAGVAPAATLTASTGNDMITSGSIQSFLLYGRPNTLFPNQMVVDELRIGTSWADVTSFVPEPAAVTLIGLGLSALWGWRRARAR